MISTIEEVRKVKDLFECAKTELLKEGTPFDERIPFGVMVKIPSAAILADQLAKEVDFSSV